MTKELKKEIKQLRESLNDWAIETKERISKIEEEHKELRKALIDLTNCYHRLTRCTNNIHKRVKVTTELLHKIAEIKLK